ncbi:MAG: 2-amino-4-hydroxy-6-hydroxymethyldihydropteridine diphosphokinase, partial [Gemmataceae bacterium]
MAIAHLAIGSNLGHRAATLAAALRKLRAEPGIQVLAASQWYETAPVGGPPDQGDYLNGAICVRTEQSPQELLQTILRIEQSLGRIRTVKDAPRTLDLDLLLYDQVILNSPDLVVPHPRLHERAFVLVPLAEIAAEAVHPIFNQTICELLALLPDTHGVRPADAATVALPPAPLAGLRILVTGSTQGIGRAIAETFLAAGATVFTHGRTPRPTDPQHFAVDFNDTPLLKHFADSVWNATGGLDVLVNNAGADTLTGLAAKWSFEQKLQALLAVDLKATMLLSRAVGAAMKTRGHGLILTVGWDQAETGMEGDSGQLFAAVKGAIMCFTRSLATELAPAVRVNCLAPGWIRTAWGNTAPTVWQERV